MKIKESILNKLVREEVSKNLKESTKPDQAIDRSALNVSGVNRPADMGEEIDLRDKAGLDYVKFKDSDKASEFATKLKSGKPVKFQGGVYILKKNTQPIVKKYSEGVYVFFKDADSGFEESKKQVGENQTENLWENGYAQGYRDGKSGKKPYIPIKEMGMSTSRKFEASYPGRAWGAG